MSRQDLSWSRAAKSYEAEFIDPYRADVRSPLAAALARLAGSDRAVADLGCGIGPLLPELAESFGVVYAVDFAEGMLQRAKERCAGLRNVTLLNRSLTDLGALRGKLDVAVAVNSLVIPEIPELEKALRQIHAALRPGGHLVAILPAMDAVHYYTMLLLDRALEAGLPWEAAQKNAAHYGEHGEYDFAFGQFTYRGLEQHFWQPFEVRHRLKRAGFRKVRLAKVLLSWEQFSCAADLKSHPPPWDWFVEAES
jgi:SAM-dependent methyltransferase